jgi:hypothetical protein
MGAVGAGERKPFVDMLTLLRTGENFSEKSVACPVGVGEVMDMPSSLMVMDELNERSTSIGNSVSVPVGDGGEEGKAGMVKLSARGDDENESIMFIE